MDDGAIREYFKFHKLSPSGIRNFLMYTEGAREYARCAMMGHHEYKTEGEYITCLVKNIILPKCVACGKTLTYKQYTNGRTHCSMKCFGKDNAVMERRKSTVMERYGVSNPSMVHEFNEKRKNTIIERYGVDSILRNPKFVARQKQTMVERYGVDSYQKTDESKKKAHHKSYQTIQSWSNYVMPLFTEEEYHGWKHGEVYGWKCSKCGNEFESGLYVTGINEIERLPRCINCYPFSRNVSEGEVELAEFISSIYNGKMVCNDRSILDGLELDIFLPEKKIAFEFDGLFFHNENSGKGKYYHLYKTEECEKREIHLIHVFEDEWIRRKDIVKDRISSILGVGQKRVFARKCTIKEINAKESSGFLDTNHLQGRDNSKYRHGLFYNGELVAVMTFGRPRFSNGYDYEMIRYCCRIGYNVVGGAGKLMAYFMKSHSASVVSYADRRYSNGNLYDKLGFTRKECSQPNYWWCKQKAKLSRYQCQKHKLALVLGDKFDASKSESENMRANGWSKIYDCGNIVFVKNAN